MSLPQHSPLLTVGTSAIITHSLAKRDAEADPLHKEAGHAVHHIAPATHEIDNEVCNYSYQQKIEETTADIPENAISKVINYLTWIVFVQEDHSTAPGTMVGPVAPNPLQGVPVRHGQIHKDTNNM